MLCYSELAANKGFLNKKGFLKKQALLLRFKEAGPSVAFRNWRFVFSGGTT